VYISANDGLADDRDGHAGAELGRSCTDGEFGSETLVDEIISGVA
jgi:hypothetical protein